MNKSIKEAIDSRLSAVNASEDLASKIKIRANSRAKRITFPLKRMLAVAATFCLVIVLSVGVMAANIPQLNSLFAIVGSKISTFVQPIVKTSEHDGIKMEVIAALNDNDSVIIYLTLQDLTQNRIDSTINLYNLEIPGVVFPHAEVINFDEASRIATVKIVGMNGKELNESKISVQLKTILSGNKMTEYSDTNITIGKLKELNSTPLLYYPEQINGGTWNFDDKLLSPEDKAKLSIDKMSYLKPETMTLLFPEIGWTYLSGYGLIDNTLHLQVNPSDTDGRYNELFFALANPRGELLTDLFSVTSEFGERVTEGFHDYSDYKEHVFLLPESEDIDDYKIYSSQNTYSNRIDGNWNTTFILQSNSKEKRADCIINMNPWEITEVSVSAIGVTLRGQGQMYEHSTQPDVTVKRLDGSVVECNASSSKFESTPDGNELIVMQNMFNLPIDVNEIASVNINGIDIALK